MAYTTCTFWIKFFTFFVVAGFVAMLLNTNMVIAWIICSPILFANQIYRLIKKERSEFKSVSQVNNKKWLHENYDVLTNEYENTFVAVYNKEIIDSDTNLTKLKTRIQEQIKSLTKVYIEFISPKKMADYYEKLK